jgi:hypothetical protein
MGASAQDEPPPGWPKPPDDECEEAVYTLTPDGADHTKHRVKLRMVSPVETGDLVEFAVVQQTHDRGKWRYVVEVDSCHDVDVHLHRYSRLSDARVGEPEVLTPVAGLNDLQRGYDLAYDHVFEHWAGNVERWRHA